MTRNTLVDRFYLVLMPALSLVVLLSLACSSSDEPVAEVVQDDNAVVVTTAVEVVGG